MNKKIGRFKVWHLLVIGAALGAAVYFYKRSHPEPNNLEEYAGGTGTGAYGPIDPNSGIPYAFETGLGGGGGAGETLGQFLSKVGELRDAGFFGSPEKEVITEERPGPGEAELEHARTAAQQARKAAREARKAQRKEHKARVKAEHKHKQKHHTTGGTAHTPHTHHSPQHPAHNAQQNAPQKSGGSYGGGQHKKQKQKQHH
jgi:hypothetical protein